MMNLLKNELRQIEADDQAIQTSLLGLPEDIYAVVDSYETAQEIWFTFTDGDSIESYYHRFLKLMNDFNRNKHFSEKIANDLRAERLAKTQDPLALIATSNNPYNFPVFPQDQPSPSTYMQQPLPNNNIMPQPSFNENYMQQPMSNLEDITDPTTATNMTLALMAKQFKLNYSTPAKNNKRISSNPHNRQIAQPGNQNGYNAVQNVQNQVVHNAVQNPRVQNVGNQNGLIVVPGIANQNPNGNGNLVATRDKGNVTGNNHNQIRCYNCRGLGHFARNYTVRPRRRDVAYLQTQLLIAQKEEAGIQLQAKYKHRHRVLRLTKLPSMTQTDQLSKQMTTLNEEISTLNKQLLIEKSTVSTLFEEKKKLKSDFKILEDELLGKQNQLENKIKELDNVLVKTEAAKFVQDFKSLAKEADESLAKHKALELEIERLLRSVVSQDIMSIVQHNSVGDSSNLQTKLEHTKERFKIVSLKRRMNMLNFGMISTKSVKNENTTKFHTIKLIMSCNKRSNGCKLNWEISKVGETHALSKPVTSNSIPPPQESKVVKNDKVITPRMFRINPFKPSREEKYVPNKVRASVRTNLITASQPPVITKKVVNSNSNGFSSIRVNNTAKTRRPHHMSNSNTDKVPSKSKSSCLSNNQCLGTASHDVCVLNYVNDMNSNADNQSTNVSIHENRKKHKANAKKSKELGSKGSLASSKPNKPRTCLRWIPTRRIFAMCGKSTASNNTENKFEKCVCSNPSKPSSKGFLNSASFLGRLQPVLQIKWECTLQCALPYKEEKSSCFHFSRYYSHDVNDKSRKVYSVICLMNNSNGENQFVSKSSVVTTADASDKLMNGNPSRVNIKQLCGRLSKIYLEKLNFLPVDKQMTADAAAELNSFHEVRLALIDCKMVWMRNFHWLEKKDL
uniref:CCHC-type domain-containing protein n=1 Tax=Tanacetum cinerariifolium TaxID=118510 RepID=A0A6L2P0K7_TANCI|nr:hypothetical protein [Tanacetum cinerariifolium]